MILQIKILEKIKIKEEEFDKIFNLFLNELLPKSYLENYRNIKNNNLIKNMIENSKKFALVNRTTMMN